MKKHLIKTSLLLACALTKASIITAAEKPNVLMIVLDDLNDYAGVMQGHPQAKTPNLDRLAKNGVLFNNAHSNCPVCSPSRASFMTGVLPTTSGCWGFNNPAANKIVSGSKTIAQYAQENGYLTYQTGKVLHHKVDGIWDEKGIAKSHGPYASDGKVQVAHPSCPKGMAEFGALDSTFAPLSDVPTVPATATTSETAGWWSIQWGQKPKAFRYVNDNDRDKMVDERSVAWMKNKIRALEKSGNTKPFLFAFGIMRPHTPLIVPQKYFDMFPLDKITLPIVKKNDKKDCGLKNDKSRGEKIYKALVEGYSDPEEGLRRYTQAYLACVKFADDIIGEAISTIENSKFKDNTIIILFSDHGYHIGEKDELWKYTHWEESTRVPFIIKDFRYAKNAGMTVDHPISLIDVFPTIKDLCGMTGSTTKNVNGAPLDGHSLKPFLENPETGKWDGPDVAITVTDSYKSKMPRQQHLSARSKDWRYIRYNDGFEELYDHRNDKHEWNNLIDNPEFSSVKTKLKKQLYEIVPETIKSVQGGNKQTSEEASAEKWKNTYFKKNPEADTDDDGKLSWPEFHAYKKKVK